MSGNVHGVGPPEFSVRTTAGVERAGSATDRKQKRNPRQEQREREQERRDQTPPNPQRRRLYDLLFDEVDQLDGMDERQRTRLKDNLRSHLSHRAPTSATAPTATPHDEEALAEGLLKDPAASLPVDPEHIVQAATAAAPEQDPETMRLAEQLRDCLARNTDRARKVAVYLHLLLTLEGAFRPHMVVDV
ncbi:hypothetical protein EI613_06615 [Azospirillum sp. 412522]|nr:hypothetical protein [Azospirillum sp. 412522]MBY6261603.1 hypothetical protein [Azospirillum sp. 412522]